MTFFHTLIQEKSSLVKHTRFVTQEDDEPQNVVAAYRQHTGKKK